jgi:hypothetical protein
MSYLTIGYSLIILLLTTVVSAEESSVDFSKAYIIYGTEMPTELRLGGITTHSNDVMLVHSLLLGFNSAERSFNLLNVELQSSDTELLQQRLLQTHWTGTYTTSKNLYLTELTLKTVQNGFIGGEVIHRTADPETSNLLRAEVGGSITTQYFIDPQGKNEWIWVNANEVTVETLVSNPPVRHLIRLKRLRGLEFKHTNSRWGSQSEYRLVLENNRLTGDVGTPPEDYTNNDGLTGIGLIELVETTPRTETFLRAPLE